MTLKSALLITVISAFGCQWLPKVPQHTQYGIYGDVNPPGFYGVNNETEERVYRSFADPRMKGGQCLDSKDYKKMQQWIKQVKEQAEKHCQ